MPSRTTDNSSFPGSLNSMTVISRSTGYLDAGFQVFSLSLRISCPELLFVLSGDAVVVIGFSRPTADDAQGFLQELRCLLAVGALEPHGVDGDFPRGGDDDFDCWFHCCLVGERRTRSNWNSVSDQSRAWMADFNRSMRTSVTARRPL